MKLLTAASSGLQNAAASIGVAYSTVETPVVLQTGAGSPITGCNDVSRQAFATALQQSVGLGLLDVDVGACSSTTTPSASGRRRLLQAVPSSCSAFATSTPSIVLDTTFNIDPAVDPAAFQPLLYATANTLFNRCRGTATKPPPSLPRAPPPLLLVSQPPSYGPPPSAPDAPQPPLTPALPGAPPPQPSPPPGALCRGSCAPSANDTAGGAWVVRTVLQVTANFSVSTLSALDGDATDASSLTTRAATQQVNDRLLAALVAANSTYSGSVLASVPVLYVIFAPPPPPGAPPHNPAAPLTPPQAKPSPPQAQNLTTSTSALAPPPPPASGGGGHSALWWVVLIAVGGACVLAAVASFTYVFHLRHKRKMAQDARDATARDNVGAAQSPSAEDQAKAGAHPLTVDVPDADLDDVRLDVGSYKDKGRPPGEEGAELWGTDPVASPTDIPPTSPTGGGLLGAAVPRRWMYGHGKIAASAPSSPGVTDDSSLSGGQSRSPQLVSGRQSTVPGGDAGAASSTAPLSPLGGASSNDSGSGPQPTLAHAMSMSSPRSASRILRGGNGGSVGGGDGAVSGGLTSFKSIGSRRDSLPGPNSGSAISGPDSRRSSVGGGNTFNPMRSGAASSLPRQDSGSGANWLSAIPRPMSYPGIAGGDERVSAGSTTPSAPQSPIRNAWGPSAAPVARSNTSLPAAHATPLRRASFAPAKITSESDMRRHIMQTVSRHSSMRRLAGGGGEDSSAQHAEPGWSPPSSGSNTQPPLVPLSPPPSGLARWLSSEISAASAASASSAPATPSRFVSPSSPGVTRSNTTSGQITSPGVSRSNTRRMLHSADQLHHPGVHFGGAHAAPAAGGLDRWLSGELGAVASGGGPPVVPGGGGPASLPHAAKPRPAGL